MSKIVLTDINGGKDLSQINNNFQAIEDELNNKVLYRDNPVGETNSLQTDIDANGKRIINLPDPVSNGEPATKGWSKAQPNNAAASAASALASKNAAAASAAAAAHPWAVESGGIYYDGGAVRLGAAGARILGDFSNATLISRALFQTAGINTYTSVGAVPSGSGSGAYFVCYGSSNPDNASASYVGVDQSAGHILFASTKIGTGAYLPMAFYTGGSERLRIDSSGRLGIGGVPFSLFDLYTPVGRTFLTYNGSAQAISTVNLANNAQVDLNFLAGNVTLNTPTGGLGYGTGAGGTVTQATSKSTSVTLNKPTGQITMNNTALAAGALVEFVLSNNLITANDLVIVNPVAGTYVGSAATYLVSAVPGAGYAYITIQNRSATSYSEAFKINFAVIKGAIA